MCNSCECLGTSRLHEKHESKFSFVSRIKFIRSKLSNFSAHVYGVADSVSLPAADCRRRVQRSIPCWERPTAVGGHMWIHGSPGSLDGAVEAAIVYEVALLFKTQLLSRVRLTFTAS